MDSKPHFLSAPPPPTTTMLRPRAQTGPPSPDNSTTTTTRTGSFKMSCDAMSPRLDEFEFETNGAFSGHLGFDEGREKCRARGDLPPNMAFADELFVNGRVMPLKLPPRLQGDTEFNRPHVSQPKSPRTRISFARKGSWAGDYDPFMTALEKVREENRSRNSHHKRSRSHSPFRAMPKFTDATSGHSNQDIIRQETSTKSSRSFLLSKRVGSIKIDDGPDKPVESKVQKLKGFLLKYASFGKDNKQTKETSNEEARKQGYFSRLSFRFKAKGQKRMPADTQMTIVEYNPAFTISDG